MTRRYAHVADETLRAAVGTVAALVGRVTMRDTPPAGAESAADASAE